MNYFCHEKSIVESKNIGNNSRIWAFAHILPDAKIGNNANICDHVFIENNVIIGNNVTIKCGVQVWDGLRIEDNVFVGPNVTFTNDPFPRSKNFLDKHPITTIEYNASLGANSTILPGLTVSYGAMIGAGTVLTKNAPAFSIVVGNPGNVVRYQYDTISKKTCFKELPFELSDQLKSFNLIDLSNKNYDYCFSNSKTALFTNNNVDVVLDNKKTRTLHKLNSRNNYLEIDENIWVSMISADNKAIINILSEQNPNIVTNYKSFIGI